MNSELEIFNEIANEPDESYIPQKRQIKQKIKLSREPRNYKESKLEEFYRLINWNNQTFVHDSRRFFALCNAVIKKRGESTLISTLAYCQEKGKLHPNYICGALSNKLK